MVFPKVRGANEDDISAGVESRMKMEATHV